MKMKIVFVIIIQIIICVCLYNVKHYTVPSDFAKVFKKYTDGINTKTVSMNDLNAKFLRQYLRKSAN